MAKETFTGLTVTWAELQELVSEMDADFACMVPQCVKHNGTCNDFDMFPGRKTYTICNGDIVRPFINCNWGRWREGQVGVLRKTYKERGQVTFARLKYVGWHNGLNEWQFDKPCPGGEWILTRRLMLAC